MKTIENPDNISGKALDKRVEIDARIVRQKLRERGVDVSEPNREVRVDHAQEIDLAEVRKRLQAENSGTLPVQEEAIETDVPPNPNDQLHVWTPEQAREMLARGPQALEDENARKAHEKEVERATAAALAAFDLTDEEQEKK